MAESAAAATGEADLALISAVLAGDRDRYGELVRRYQRAAWALAYSFVGNWDDAKELSQNGFIRAYQRLASFRGRAKFSTWLYRIIVNECKDWLRARSRRPVVVPLAAADAEGEAEVWFDPADAAPNPQEALAHRELSVRLQAAIEALPDRQGAAFRLHHVDGYSLDDVAAIMGCRVGTVKAHVFRACEQLRRHLGPYLNGRMG